LDAGTVPGVSTRSVLSACGRQDDYTGDIMTRSAKTAFELPGPQNIFIVHAGDDTFPLPARVTAAAAGRMLSSGDNHMDT